MFGHYSLSEYHFYKDCSNIIKYMKNNKKGVKKKVAKKPSPPPIFPFSTIAASSIVNGMLENVDDAITVIERKIYLDRNLSKYSYIHHLYNIEDFFHRMLAFEDKKVKFPEDNQPKSIPVDSLSHANSVKQEAKTIISVKDSVKQSRVSTISRTESKAISKKMKKGAAIQLNLETIQQNKFISQLREKKKADEEEVKMKGQREQEERKLLERRQAYQSLKISYDYSGQILPRVEREPNNLVKKVLQLKLNKQRISKKGLETPQEEPIQSFKTKGYKKKERQKKKKESQFTEFLDSQSLAESMDITRGIKYSHNSLVFQEKKRTQSISDLRSNLGRRRISKPEFSKIKEDTQKKRQSRLKKIKTEQYLESRQGYKRAFSEANFDISRFRKREAINVINPELKESMLIRLEDYENFLVIEKEFPPEFEDCLAKDTYEEVSNGQNNKNQNDASRVTERERMTPKLPPISRKSTPQLKNKDELVISKLYEELRNK